MFGQDCFPLTYKKLKVCGIVGWGPDAQSKMHFNHTPVSNCQNIALSGQWISASYIWLKCIVIGVCVCMWSLFWRPSSVLNETFIKHSLKFVRLVIKKLNFAGYWSFFFSFLSKKTRKKFELIWEKLIDSETASVFELQGKIWIFSCFFYSLSAVFVNIV